jgi:hypothetical protein
MPYVSFGKFVVAFTCAETPCLVRQNLFCCYDLHTHDLLQLCDLRAVFQSSKVSPHSQSNLQIHIDCSSRPPTDPFVGQIGLAVADAVSAFSSLWSFSGTSTGLESFPPTSGAYAYSMLILDSVTDAAGGKAKGSMGQHAPIGQYEAVSAGQVPGCQPPTSTGKIRYHHFLAYKQTFFGCAGLV